MGRYDSLVITAFLGLALGGCAVENTVNEQALRRDAAKDAADLAGAVAFDASRSEPFDLSKVQFRINPGTTVAYYPFIAWTCNYHEDIANQRVIWAESRYSSGDPQYSDLFYEVMKKERFNVVGDPGRLFGVAAERGRSIYQVGAQIRRIYLELCTKLFTIAIGGRGEMEVDWQVFSKLRRKVVYSTTTKGRKILADGVENGDWKLLEGAFADAVRRLARDPGFFAAVSAKADEPGAVAASAAGGGLKPIRLSRLEPLAGKLAENIDRVRSAVVTIAVGDGSHGSGFFINSKGFLLTNAHVVGEAKFVRVELFSGRGILGEVLRTDRRRDVALVLTEESRFPALAIREKPPVITEDVYAVGTPLRRALRTTVTKGTVSGFREDKTGLKLIQGDVDIQGGNSGGPLVDASGNVIGITVSQIGQQQTSIGVNFFIPIWEALRALNIEFKDRTADSGAATKRRKKD